MEVKIEPASPSGPAFPASPEPPRSFSPESILPIRSEPGNLFSPESIFPTKSEPDLLLSSESKLPNNLEPNVLYLSESIFSTRSESSLQSSLESVIPTKLEPQLLSSPPESILPTRPEPCLLSSSESILPTKLESNLLPPVEQTILDSPNHDIQAILDAEDDSDIDVDVDKFSDEYFPSDADYGASDSDAESDIPVDYLLDESTDEETAIPIIPSAADEWETPPVLYQTFPFQGNPGVNSAVVPDNVGAYQMFRILFSDKLLDMIVTETNRYASQLKDTSQLKIMKDWKDLSKEELLVFLAVVFHMGVVKLPGIRNYWRKDILYRMDFFTLGMTRDRFVQLLGRIHFADNETADKSVKTWQCKPIIDYFNETMHMISYPGEQMCIDESMMNFRGRLQFSQYITNKRHKYGVKFYMLCFVNGLTQKLLVYGGKGDLEGKQGHPAEVVHTLMEKYKGQGHSLYMNNFFNSVNLAKKLLSEKTHCTGTFRKKRKNNSSEVVAAKVKKGETFSRHRDGVVQIKWQDKKDVLAMSTVHSPDGVDILTKRKQTKNVPDIIAKYNKYMSGIDVLEKRMSFYDITRKARTWYRKVVFRIFHVMIMNANLMANKTKRLSTLAFHETIVKGLLEEAKVFGVFQERERDLLGHFPRYNAPSKNRKVSMRRCRYCSTAKNVNKRTSYFCIGCPTNPPLCVSCFEHFEHKV